MKTTWVDKFNNILTKQRLSYAWIAGGALWLAWLWSIFLGSNGIDRAGQVIGTDYIQFYAAGQTLLRGESANLYDFHFQSSLEVEIIGPGLTSFHAFITPPLFAVLFAPLALLPYTLSYAIWSLMGLLFLWISVRLLSNVNRKKIFFWSLLWFPVFASISFGQNSLLSLVILSLAYKCLQKQKYLLSGLISSLMFYKPQLLMGLIILWLLEIKIERRTLAGFTLGTLVIIVMNYIFFPEASLSYWNFVNSELPSMITRDQFPIWHMHTIRGFWMMLLDGKQKFAEILYFISVLVITVGFIKVFKRHYQNKILLYAAAICLTILITPHAMIYDWSLLLIPAILFWDHIYISKPLLTAIFTLMWIGAFISGPFAFLQRNYLNLAIQISVPIFFFSSYSLYKYILHQPIMINKTMGLKID
jgi:alpha-1,2-mannosyltransferase